MIRRVLGYCAENWLYRGISKVTMVAGTCRYRGLLSRSNVGLGYLQDATGAWGCAGLGESSLFWGES